MPKAKELTVSHQNRPGMLAEIAKALGDQRVNILSCLTTTSGTEGTTHLVVDNVDKAKKALAGAQLSYTEADVLHVDSSARFRSCANTSVASSSAWGGYYRMPRDRESSWCLRRSTAWCGFRCVRKR